jgi:hypothetical protein
MAYISVVNGMTHVYEEIQKSISPRCSTSKNVKKSNLTEVDEEQLKKYIKDDKVCYNCLRYKKGVII